MAYKKGIPFNQTVNFMGSRLNFSFVLPSVFLRFSLEKGNEALENIKKDLPEAIANALLRVGRETRSAIGTQLEATKSSRYWRQKPGTPKIMDYITVRGPWIATDSISVGVAPVDELETNVPWYKFQEEGIRPFTRTVERKVKKPFRGEATIQSIVISHPGVPARRFLQAGWLYLNTKGPNDFDIFLTEELNKITGK